MTEPANNPNPESRASGDMLIEGQPLVTTLKEIVTKLDHLEREQQKTNTKLDHLEREQEKTNIIVETYQKASGQVVNLAFGLIATATITIVLSAIVNK